MYTYLALRASGAAITLASTAGITNVVGITEGAEHSLALIGNGPPTLQPVNTSPAMNTNGFSFSVETDSGRVYVMQSEPSPKF